MSNGKSPKERKDWIEKMIEENKINLIKWPELESVEQHKVGGYGIVYKAQWCKKNVALKHMVIEDGKAEFEHKVLVKEVKAFISIKSVTSMPSQTGYENIIQCLGISIGIEPDPKFYLVLEFAEHGNLREYLMRRS